MLSHYIQSKIGEILMSIGENKFIRILLIIIAIASLILIIKINITPKYDPKIYEEVYSEYENIVEKAESTNDTNNFNNTDMSNTNEGNIIYKVSGITSGKNTYTVAGKIEIPKINVAYPIVKETSDEYLKVAPTKYAGPRMHSVGNYCIVGHNYKNDQFFSNLSQLKNNDEIYLTSNSGKKLSYFVYAKYEVNENDLSCTSQETNGKIEATLITCTTNKQNRLVVKCKATT